jgi:uncharacterized membrane protein (UPF0127 family)
VEVQAGGARRSAGQVSRKDSDHHRGHALKRHFLLPLTARDPGPLRLTNERTGAVLATTLEPAFDSATRNRGLLGRTDLAPGHALIIAPSNMVHTFFMRFCLDLLFASRTGTVLKLRTDVPARRIVGSLRAFAVIEMRAGSLHGQDVRPGDRLQVL